MKKHIILSITALVYSLSVAAFGTAEKRALPMLEEAITVTDTATFATGCFWCTEAKFSQIKGVLKVTPGYTGGG